MKKTTALILSLLLLFCTPFSAFAVSTASSPISASAAAYDPDSVDWENIDEIVVFFYTGHDPFIEDALARGIPVTIEAGALAVPRYTYFNSMSWITRNGVVSLSLTPKDPYTIDKEPAWAEACLYFQYHPIYTQIDNPTKLNSMYNQFVCHADFARGFKTPWNIEPVTPDKGYWGFVGSGCN